jgi:hypothetical protein
VPRAVKEKDESIFNSISRMLETPKIDDEHLLQIGKATDESLFGTEVATVNLEVLTRLIKQRRRIVGAQFDESPFPSHPERSIS